MICSVVVLDFGFEEMRRWQDFTLPTIHDFVLFVIIFNEVLVKSFLALLDVMNVHPHLIRRVLHVDVDELGALAVLNQDHGSALPLFPLVRYGEKLG